jgi:hypothetical protein
MAPTLLAKKHCACGNNQRNKTPESPRAIPSIHDQILGQLAAFDPIPMAAWDTFEFLFCRGLFAKQEDMSICFLSYVHTLAELNKKGLIRPAVVTASERWVLTNEGRQHINMILGLAGANIRHLQDIIRDRPEETLKLANATGGLAPA